MCKKWDMFIDFYREFIYKKTDMYIYDETEWRILYVQT